MAQKTLEEEKKYEFVIVYTSNGARVMRNGVFVQSFPYAAQAFRFIDCYFHGSHYMTVKKQEKKE